MVSFLRRIKDFAASISMLLLIPLDFRLSNRMNEWGGLKKYGRPRPRWRMLCRGPLLLPARIVVANSHPLPPDRWTAAAKSRNDGGFVGACSVLAGNFRDSSSRYHHFYRCCCCYGSKKKKNSGRLWIS